MVLSSNSRTIGGLREEKTASVEFNRHADRCRVISVHHAEHAEDDDVAAEVVVTSVLPLDGLGSTAVPPTCTQAHIA